MKVYKSSWKVQRLTVELRQTIIPTRVPNSYLVIRGRRYSLNCNGNLQIYRIKNLYGNKIGTLREEGQANTQKILDAICQNQIAELRDKLADRDRELQTARFQISQIDQTASLTNTLRPFPQPAYITASPYQSYYPYGYYGYGNGVSGVV